MGVCHCITLLLCYLSPLQLYIGFEEIGYRVNVGLGIVRFRVRVLLGTQSRDVAVLFHTEDRNAEGLTQL